MNKMNISRRSLLKSATVLGSAGVLAGGAPLLAETPSGACEEEILGQGELRYRAVRHWGVLDRSRYPVKDCHGMTEDRNGRIVMLTNDTHNNLIAYNKQGKLLSAWETRYPAAHGLEIQDHQGEDLYWITDHDLQCVAVHRGDGTLVRRTGPDAVAAKYPNINQYHPTNCAFTSEGEFFISDGYGSSFVHHFDPQGKYIASFGGVGPAPENLNEPHAVWMDTRSGKPSLLVCDRGNETLKWFSFSGELLRSVPVPGARPSNVAQFPKLAGGRYEHYIAIASLNGMILILDAADRVVSVVGGEPAVYREGKLQPIEVYNDTFRHPHDVYVDAQGSLYVPQWWSNQTYPIKLELVKGK
ncbi:MAG: 6-bladed beta-propeller [Acidobacteria bacterium]|nr:6-bladed beta-propeller [Acidobacteriota bacterium]